MANTLLNLQLSIPAGVKTPFASGDKRLTLHNLVNYLAGGLNAGKMFKLSGSSAYLQVNPTMVAATATAACATVVNGNTITIAGTALTATKQRATGTVTCATALAAQTVTINGTVFTAVSGAATLGDATFSIDTGNTETATSLAAQVNGYGGPAVAGLIGATSSSGVVTLYAKGRGTSGNSLTLASSDGGTLAVSGAALSGGAAIANNQFDFTTNALCADSLAYAITNSTTAAVQQVTAVSDGVDTVTMTAKLAGVGGNAITLTSVGGTITVSGSGYFTSGSQGAATRWSF